MSIHDFIAALEALGLLVRPRGPDRWESQCPLPGHAHGDRRPSLRLSTGAGGKVLAYCGVHLRCFEELRAVLGIDRSGPTPPMSPPPSASPPKPRPSGGRPQLGPRPLPPHAARYDYEKGNGQLAFVVLRFEPKDFAQYTPSETPGLFYPMGPPAPKPLFQLPRLMYASGKRRRAMVVEGEKDAINARRAELHRMEPTLPRTVTTWAGGASAWRLTDWTPLAGWTVDLVAHADTAGRRAMWEIASHLDGLGCTVRMLLPSDIDNDLRGNDLSDWIGRDRFGPYLTAHFLAGKLRPFDPNDPPPPAPGPAPGPSQPTRTGTFRDNLDYSPSIQRKRGQRRVQQRREANATRDARIHELRLQGLTVEAIADALNMAPRTLYHVLAQSLAPSNEAKAQKMIALLEKEAGLSIPDAARKAGLPVRTSKRWLKRLGWQGRGRRRRGRASRGARGREDCSSLPLPSFLPTREG